MLEVLLKLCWGDKIYILICDSKKYNVNCLDKIELEFFSCILMQKKIYLNIFVL